MAVKGNTTRRAGDEVVAVTSDYLYLYYFFVTRHYKLLRHQRQLLHTDIQIGKEFA
jgi:hypothetical protein